MLLLSQVTEAKLEYDHKLSELFHTCVTSCDLHLGDECMQKCMSELTGKIVNACKKDWDIARKRHQHGRDTSSVLREESHQ